MVAFVRVMTVPINGVPTDLPSAERDIQDIDTVELYFYHFLVLIYIGQTYTVY